LISSLVNLVSRERLKQYIFGIYTEYKDSKNKSNLTRRFLINNKINLRSTIIFKSSAILLKNLSKTISFGKLNKDKINENKDINETTNLKIKEDNTNEEFDHDDEVFFNNQNNVINENDR